MTQAEIKQVRSLREKKFRDESGLFVVEGEKMVQEALASDFEVVRVWRREEIGEAAMERISQLSSPSPVLAVVARPAEPAEPAFGHALYLALDGVRDPGNLGTILRIADWFGVTAVFLSGDCVEPYNPKSVQSSMGSIFRVRAVTADLPALARRFRAAGMRVYGTFLDGKNLYGEALDAEGLVVMGNEAAGIRPALAAEVDARLLIPPYGGSGRPGAESLNVAAATAVTLSEFRRR
ncbi:MAG: RNA methyltransferase [Bacteroidales bacterium]|nr:RNA methyltransferase [Bacteroidales bacterium]